MHRCQHVRQYYSGGHLGHLSFFLESETRLQRNKTAGGIEEAPEETIPGASTTFKKVQLRLLMKEREDVVSRLVELDYAIWTLEEHFRAGNPS